MNESARSMNQEKKDWHWKKVGHRMVVKQYTAYSGDWRDRHKVSSEDAAHFDWDDFSNSRRGSYWQNTESLQTVVGAGPKNRNAPWVTQGQLNEHSKLIAKN